MKGTALGGVQQPEPVVARCHQYTISAIGTGCKQHPTSSKRITYISHLQPNMECPHYIYINIIASKCLDVLTGLKAILNLQ